jgi:hypothetical protein
MNISQLYKVRKNGEKIYMLDGIHGNHCEVRNIKTGKTILIVKSKLEKINGE